MNWMINVTVLLLITTLTGSIAQMIWRLAKCFLERNGYLHWCYKGLWIVVFFYLAPAAYAGMVFAEDVYSLWGGVLLQPTPILIGICRIVIVLWLLGMAVMAVRLLQDIMAVHRLQHSSTICRKWEQEFFAHVCKSLQIPERKVRLCRNREMVMPSFGGILHPMVFIPEMEFTKEQLHTVLWHELTHYKQRASWLVMAARIVRVTQWFNPLAWTLGDLADKWGEFDCDAKNCNRVGSTKKYFEVIIDILEKASESEGAMTTYLTKNEHEMKERMQHMNKFGKRKKKPAGVMALLAVILMGTYSLTVVAASDGAGNIYRYCYDMTVVETEEQPMITVDQEEYTDEGPGSDITVEEGEVLQRSRASVSFYWNVPADTMKRTSGFYVKADQKITVKVLLDPRDKEVKVGIVDSSGRRRYVRATDEVNHDFAISTAGTYRVFVENENAVSVEVDGTYAVR